MFVQPAAMSLQILSRIGNDSSRAIDASFDPRDLYVIAIFPMRRKITFVSLGAKGAPLAC
jgi:hypothetical protein